MRDPELMEQLLREALAGKPPELSADFERRVLSAVRPRRLSRTGRWVLATYSVLSAMATTWLLRDIAPTVLAAAGAVTVLVAAAATPYASRLSRTAGAPGREAALAAVGEGVPSDMGFSGRMMRLIRFRGRLP